MHSMLLLFLCAVLTFKPVTPLPQFLDLPKFPPPVEINELNPKDHPRATATKASLDNLEETVREVEDILKSNPDLPRLTRGEILDLLENITKSDLAQSIREKSGKKMGLNEKDPKAVMLVMPYTAENADEKNMEELFTKPPVTHIIGPQTFTKGGKVDVEDRNKIGDEPKKPPTFIRNKYRGDRVRRTTTTTTTTTTRPSYTFTTARTPNKQSTLQHFGAKTTGYRKRRPSILTTTARPTTTNTPFRRRPQNKRPTRFPNHRYPDESGSSVSPITLPDGGLRIINPPRLDPHVINDDLMMTEDQRKDVVYTDDGPLVVEGESSEENFYDGDLASQPSASVDVSVPAKGFPPNTNLSSALNATTSDPVLPVDEAVKIRDLLASFNALPQKTSTTTTSIPDISNVAENLSPEMRDLLMSFGLIPTSEEKTAASSHVGDSYNPEKAEVKPESYVGFKPLPDDTDNRNEMKELLARFGLGRNGKNDRKGVKKPGNELSYEAVPEEYQGVLEDIGFGNREGKLIRPEALSQTKGKQHVFNPQDSQQASEDQINKLNKLLGIFKQIEKLNGSVSDDDLKKFGGEDIKELIASLSQEDPRKSLLDEHNAPDPLKYDYGLTKNEVKRQEQTEGTESPTTTTESTSQEDKVEGPSITDLEESFGGKTEVVTEPPQVETTTPSRRTGFYYLVDWNTFLDIDDAKGKRVNLRFQPTIGDPKRFYSVSVP